MTIENPQSTSRTLEQRLKEVGVTIEFAPDAPELHAEIEREGFEGLPNNGKSLEKAVAAAREYALSPILRDTFGNDHGLRRTWRTQLPPELAAAERNNKLRANSLMGISGHLGTFISELEALEIHTEQAEAVRTLYDTFPHEQVQGYVDLPIEEKERLIREMDRFCREFLRVVTGSD